MINLWNPIHKSRVKYDPWFFKNQVQLTRLSGKKNQSLEF